MTTITIPKKLAQKGDLVIIPRKEYDMLLSWQERPRVFKTVKPTAEEKRIIKEGRNAIKKGDFITLAALRKQLRF